MASRSPWSMIDKLARCQKILGYKFQDVSLLKRSLTLKRNRRMATAGDTYVRVALMDRWYSMNNLSSGDFSTIVGETLSNYNLGKVGFKRKLDTCTVPERCVDHHQMADTVEAVIAAVYRDALFKDGIRKATNWDAFEGVLARLGINHRLIASASDFRWRMTPLRTSRKVPVRFFSKGHHLELARILAQFSGTFQSRQSGMKVDKRKTRPTFLSWLFGRWNVAEGPKRWVMLNGRRRGEFDVSMGPIGTWLKKNTLRGSTQDWADFLNPSNRSRGVVGPSEPSQKQEMEANAVPVNSAVPSTAPAVTEAATCPVQATITVCPTLHKNKFDAEFAATGQTPGQHVAVGGLEPATDLPAVDKKRNTGSWADIESWGMTEEMKPQTRFPKKPRHFGRGKNPPPEAAGKPIALESRPASSNPQQSLRVMV